MLSFIAGNPAIREALQRGEINQGQAEQLNLVRDEIGRAQGLGWAKGGLMTARALAGWRENREVTGISDQIDQLAPILAAAVMPDYKTMAKCVLHNEFVELMKAPPRVICDECWEMVIDGINALQANPQTITIRSYSEEEDNAG